MRALLGAALLPAIAACLLAGAGEAEAQTRTLSFKQMHTGETLTVTYMRNGRHDAEGLRQINHIMRDWRRNEATKMDPRLIDTLWDVYQASGSRGPVHVLSAYRSPVTNAALRSRSSGVAENSQHTVGRALDFYLPDVPLSRLREVALRFQGGGVGFYPTSGSPFVHIDTGSVRHWPRMTRQQLAKVFPDGKTLHLPSDGKPMPGYQQAVAEAQGNRRSTTASSGSGGRQVASRGDDPASAVVAGGRAGGSQSGLLARLFNRDDAPAVAPAPQPQPSQAAPAAPAPAATPEPTVALASVAPADIPLPRTRPTVETPEPATLVAAADVPADVPMPMPRPVFEMASLPASDVPLPMARPASMGLRPAMASADAASGRMSEGAIEAILALAPSNDRLRELPFEATFNDATGPMDDGAHLVAIDMSVDALRPLVTPETGDRARTLSGLRHPDQRDLTGLMHTAEVVLVNGFARDAGASPPAAFTGAAVAPLTARSYRSASLPAPTVTGSIR